MTEYPRIPNRTSRRDFIRVSAGVLGGAAIGGFAGCGGGGGGAGGSGGGGNTGPALSLATRTAVMTAVGSYYDTLPHNSMDVDNISMLSYIKGRSEFRSATLTSTGTISALFSDGPGFVFINNLDDHDSDTRAVVSVSGSRAGVQSRAADQIPQGKAFLLTGLDVLPGSSPKSFLFDFLNQIKAQAHLAVVSTMLNITGGYQVTNDFASLAKLRSIKETDLFYFIGHGGLGIDEVTKSQIFVINTSDSIYTTAADPTLNADIAAGRVGYTLFTGTVLAGGVKERRWKLAYYITPRFVQTYMSFNKYSLVFINACAAAGSATAKYPTPGFQAAFYASQVSAFASWDNKVNSGDARDTAEFFFDRLTGANQSTVIGVNASPPVRPFDYQSVLAELQTTKRSDQNYLLSQSLDDDPLAPGDPPRSLANFLVLPNATDPDTFGLLTPSISNLSLGGTLFGTATFLAIRGIFGADPQTNGSVKIYPSGAPVAGSTATGTDLKVLSWTPTQIQCSVPSTGGDVVVTAFQHNSNPRRLTEWKGDLNYSGSGPDSHQESFTMGIQILADIESYRTQPGQVLTGANALLVPAGFMALPDATCSFTNSGTANSKFTNWTWTGGGPLSPGKSPGFAYYGTLDPVGLTMNLFYTVNTANDVTVEYKDANGDVTGNATAGLVMSTDDFPTSVINSTQLSFKLGQDLEIVANSISDSVTKDYGLGDDGTGSGTTNTSLNWSTITVTPGSEPLTIAKRAVRK